MENASERSELIEKWDRMHGGWLTALAAERLQNPCDVREVVTDTLIRASKRKIESYGEKTYLATVLRSVMVDRARRVYGQIKTNPNGHRLRATHLSLDEGYESGWPILERKTWNPYEGADSRIELDDALSKLLFKDRRAVILKAEGYSNAECAEIMGMTLAAYKNVVFKAQKHLRKIIESSREIGA